jgi:hypothetical protein
MQSTRRNPSPAAREPFHQLPDIWTTLAGAGIVLDCPRPPLRELAPDAQIGAPPDLGPTQIRKRRRFKRTMLTDSQRQILLKWLNLHQSNPYPTTTEKDLLMHETGLHREQINIWFTNNRIRQGFTATHRLDEHRAVFPPPLRV